MVLLSTHNICFGKEIRKLNFHYTLLTKVLVTFQILIIEGLKTQQIQGSLRKYIKTCYQLLIPFYFGAGVSQLTTDIAKYSIGRLRPHFITVCQPNINSCTSSTGYIEEDVCTGNDAAAIEEAR